MSTTATTSAAADRAYRAAWWALALYPVSFFLAFVTGEGLVALLGYGDEGTAPVWAVLLAGVPALVVFSLPGLLSLRLSRRARDLGHPGAMGPAVVGLTVAGGFVLLNLVSYVVGLVVG